MVKITDLLAVVLIVVVGFGAWGYKNDYIFKQKDVLVTLDVLRIIEVQREKLDTQMRLTGKIPTEAEMESLVNKNVALLEKAVDEYAKNNGVIIVERGVIIAGDVKDVTHEFIKAIQ